MSLQRFFNRKTLAGVCALLGSWSMHSQAITLKEVYLLALENDHEMRAAQAAYEAGKENKIQARSNLLPQITGSVVYTDSNSDVKSDTTISTPFAAYSSSDSTTTTYSVSLTQPLFDLGLWYQFKQGQALTDQAKAQFGADQQALIIRVAQAYFNVLRAIENLQTSLAQEDAFRHQLEQSRQRFEVGLAAITDVHEVQAAYDRATAATLAARGNLGTTFEALENITGVSPTEIAPLVKEFPVTEPVPANRADWVDFALKNNFQLKTFKYAAEAASQTAKSARSKHLPTVTASFTKSDSDSDGTRAESAFDTNTDSDTFMVRLDVPLFAGGGISSSRRKAYAQANQAEESYQKARRDTIQSARSLHLSVMIDVATVKANSQAVRSNQSALEATQAGYEVGTRDLLDVLQSQQSLYQARRDYVNSIYDYILDQLSLKQSAGNLTPTDVEDLNRWLDAQKQVERDSRY